MAVGQHAGKVRRVVGRGQLGRGGHGVVVLTRRSPVSDLGAWGEVLIVGVVRYAALSDGEVESVRQEKIILL